MASGPTFASPPVSEVSLAVYFDPSLALRTIDFGALYERWRGEYPTSVDQPLLPPVPMETFDRPSLGVTFPLGLPVGNRVWFQTEQEDQVVQVQADRLVLNWRKTTASTTYPRYSSLRPAFGRLFEDLLDFCALRGRSPAVTQVEVAYTNPIPREDGMAASDVLLPWSGRHHDAFLPAEEEVGINFRYRIPDPATGQPCGRLYGSCAPVSFVHPGAATASETFLLQLFARGSATLSVQHGNALSFLDLGHDWVVNGFVSLTTPRMHKLWGLMEEDLA